MSLLSLITSPGGIISLLTVGFLLETFLLLCRFWGTMLESFGEKEKDMDEEIKFYTSRSLNFVAVTVAVLTFLVANPVNGQSGILLLFTYALVLFLVSYKLDVIAGTRRVFRDIKQRAFNYGVLSLVLGLFLFLYAEFPSFAVLVGLGVGIVFLVHIREYWGDYKIARRIAETNQNVA